MPTLAGIYELMNMQLRLGEAQPPSNAIFSIGLLDRGDFQQADVGFSTQSQPRPHAPSALKMKAPTCSFVIIGDEVYPRQCPCRRAFELGSE
jgi:hypothetical protein